jgi:hypothetical protein
MDKKAKQSRKPVESAQQVERRLQYRINDLMNTMALACLRLQGAQEVPDEDAALVRAAELLDQYASETLHDGRDAKKVMLLMLEHEARQHQGRKVTGCNYCDPEQE